MYKANGVKNNNKPVIFSNDAAGLCLSTNAVTTTQRVFCSDRLLGTTWLAFTSVFNVLQIYKRI